MTSRVSVMLTRYKTLLKWSAVDLVRKKGLPWISLGKLLQYFIVRLWGDPRGFAHLLAAHRYYPGEHATRMLLQRRQAISSNVHSLVQETAVDEARRAARRTLS